MPDSDRVYHSEPGWRGGFFASDEMDTLLSTGEVDVYFDSPEPAAVAARLSGGPLVLRHCKSGEAEYCNVFYSFESSLTSIDDFVDKIVAFDTNVSISGDALLVKCLSEHGCQLVECNMTSAEVFDEHIEFVFSGDDENTLQWVISERVAAGVIGSSDVPPDPETQFVILAETDNVSRQVVVLGL